MLAVMALVTYKDGMKRDTLKTIAGLVIIGLIVVATFLYGNAQRQTQLNHTEQTKPKITTVTVAKPTPASQAAKPQAQPKTATTTAPVATKSVPDTGPADFAFIPLVSLGLGLYFLRRSRRALTLAVRSR
jgi:hypothetical protein